jgi:CHASE3 domain sensor protein
MKNLLKKNTIYFAIFFVGFLILISTSLSFYNETVMHKALDLKDQSETIKKATENTFGIIRKIDVSLRGYAIVKEDKFLFYTPEQATMENARAFKKLDSLLAAQGFSESGNYNHVKKGLNDYLVQFNKMVKLLEEDRRDEFIAEMRQDYGAAVWKDYKKFAEDLYKYEEQLEREANEEYELASFRNTFVQFLLIITGLPILGLLLLRLRNEAANSKNLLASLEDNNKKYLFDAGTSQSTEAESIMKTSIHNLQKAAHFVAEMTEGNYEVKWDELNESNLHLNKENLAGRLLIMREQMKKVKDEDQKRLWITEGLANLSHLIRKHQHELKELGEEFLLFLVKYLKSQQGSVFVIQEEEGRAPFLKMIAYYAFERKKYLSREIELGEGIVGQTFLEAETTILTKVPDGYTYIRSGLGDATPGCIIVVPMKYNDEVKAIVEIASFNKLEPHEVEFVEKAGEFIASAIASVSNNEKTHILLEQFKEQTEQLKSQEEELRQNMEELEATQEQMRRKEHELEARLSQTNNQV